VDLVCINVLLNKEPVDAFSVLVPRMKATAAAKDIAFKLKENLTRQQFLVHIQVVLGEGKTIASEKISPYRKVRLYHTT
jgi:GTP-binding protein LepA